MMWGGRGGRRSHRRDGKLWLDDTLAVDFGVGLSGDAVLWGDLLARLGPLLASQGRLGAYVGRGRAWNGQRR